MICSEAASTYNTKFGKIVLQIIDEIQSRREWIGVDWIEDSSSSEDESECSSSVVKSEDQKSGKTVRLLDYACGTGLVSRVCLLKLSSFSIQERLISVGARTICLSMCWC